MISTETRNRWKSRVEFLENDGVDELSGWEEGFIESVSIRLEQGTDLSPKQSKKLADIFLRVSGKLG